MVRRALTAGEAVRVRRTYGNLDAPWYGTVVRIVPAAIVEAEQKQKAATDQACLNALPLTTRVYVLNYAKAENVAPVISKTLSSRGSATAYPPRNAIIVTDVERPEQCAAAKK